MLGTTFSRTGNWYAIDARANVSCDIDPDTVRVINVADMEYHLPRRKGPGNKKIGDIYT